MFKDCVRLKRNVFVTWEECDVDEQDVGERKEFWERKRDWVISESYLSQTWLARWLALIITQKTR